MKVVVYAVGRLKRGFEADLCDRYSERIRGHGRAQSIGPVEIVEISEARAPDVVQRKDAEAAALLERIPRTAHTIALDERGKAVTSTVFATLIARTRDDGAPELAFTIGGPDGHGAPMHDAADLKLSLGPMTLPHGLARVVLLEQVYRAITILDGHPYHRA